MHRLFVAIDMPQDICDQLTGLLGGLQGARWDAHDQLHLTLRFIGEVDSPTFHDIADALGAVEAEAFELSLSGVGHFPPRGKAKILWAGVTASAALERLRDKTEAVLAGLGLERDNRKFAPHITLARFKNGAPAGPLGNYLAEHSLFATKPFPVSEFRLYSSHLSSSGAIHTIEATYPLHGVPPNWQAVS